MGHGSLNSAFKSLESRRSVVHRRLHGAVVSLMSKPRLTAARAIIALYQR